MGWDFATDIPSGPALSAGTVIATSGTVVFANSNGVTFGMASNNIVTASVAAATGGVIQAISGGTSQATSGTIVFANSNGLSFGLSGNTITGSYTQSTSPAALAAGSQTATSGSIVFANSNNVTFGMAGSTQITASIPSGATATGNFGALGAGTQTASSGTVIFANSNNLTFGMVGSSQITGSIPAGATATGNFGAVAAGTQTATSGTVVYANSNNITFGMSGSSQITASVASSIGGLGVNGFLPQFTGAGSQITNAPYSVGTDGRLALGANVLEFASTTQPAAAPAGRLAVHAEVDAGFIRLEETDETGLVARFNRDVIFIVRNTSGTGIVRGTLVYYTGSTGNIPNIALADASDKTKAPAIGILLEDTANNSFGRILCIGRISNVNTFAFTEGDTLYLSATTPGGLTNVRPSSPNLQQRVGIVVKANAASGIIDVRIFSAKGDEPGTQENLFQIGDGLVGAKTLAFLNNLGRGDLTWNPTTNRTITLPDESGTVTLNMKVVKLSLLQSSKTSTIAIPNSVTILRAVLDVTVAYDAAATWSFERTGDATKVLQTTSDNNATEVNTYEVPLTLDWGSTGAGTVKATLGGAPTVGAATLYIFYAVPVAID